MKYLHQSIFLNLELLTLFFIPRPNEKVWNHGLPLSELYLSSQDEQNLAQTITNWNLLRVLNSSERYESVSIIAWPALAALCIYWFNSTLCIDLKKRGQ